MPLQIAIDGPVAAGKGTVAHALAKRLGWLYVDTGAMYRCVTWQALKYGVNVDDEAALVRLIDTMRIELLPTQGELDGRIITVLLNDEDVSMAIRSSAVNQRVSQVAAWPRVREVLVPLQQAIANNQDVVMEGRDITSVVLPQAQLKIYLDANEEERIERFFLSPKAKVEGWTREKAAEWLRKRDEIDMTRETNPLHIMEGAWYLDRTGMEFDEVVELILKRIEALK